MLVSEKIASETTTYVRNIYKYYVIYKLTIENLAARDKAMESLKPGT